MDVVRCMSCGHFTGETSSFLLWLLARGLCEEFRGDSTLLVVVFNTPDASGIGLPRFQRSPVVLWLWIGAEEEFS